MAQNMGPAMNGRWDTDVRGKDFQAEQNWPQLPEPMFVGFMDNAEQAHGQSHTEGSLPIIPELGFGRDGVRPAVTQQKMNRAAHYNEIGYGSLPSPVGGLYDISAQHASIGHSATIDVNWQPELEQLAHSVSSLTGVIERLSMQAAIDDKIGCPEKHVNAFLSGIYAPPMQNFAEDKALYEFPAKQHAPYVAPPPGLPVPQAFGG